MKKPPILVATITALLGIIFIYLAIRISLRGEAVRITVWQADKTPEKFEQALFEHSLSKEAGKHYYLVSCIVDIQSFAPYKLQLLHAKPTTTSPNTRFYALEPNFAYGLQAFEEKRFLFTFLAVAPQHQSVAEIVRKLQFTVYAPGFGAADIPVSIPQGIEEYLQDP